MTGIGQPRIGPKEVSAMEYLFAGLCMTCNNAGECVYRRHRGGDALCCETFDNYTSRNGHGAGPVLSVVIMEPAVAEVPGMKGLCVNCSLRDECQLPRPESGVWHCEEYA
ncbi:MAG TPA: hypothetical protein VN285_11110 [Candidatus Deferrimicrobium sp.]|nr:hypothetical protein [Candidatus Deferrimicrobium sp.]